MANNQPVSEGNQPISYISVEDLFGLYTYRLPHEGSLSNAAILYGDNGVGKTTILTLIFHLLSAAGNRGHRRALFRAHYKSLEVGLSSGVVLQAIKTNKRAGGALELRITKADQKLAEWIYFPGNQESEQEALAQHYEMAKDGTVRLVRAAKGGTAEKFGERGYLAALKENCPLLFMLNADRRLNSDSLPDSNEELEMRNLRRFAESGSLVDFVAKSRVLALGQALENAATWVRTKVLQGANEGSMNVHGVYVNVLRRLIASSSSKKKSAPSVNIAALVLQLDRIESQTSALARYEFAIPLATAELRKALETGNRQARELAAELLAPYIKSLESRLDAVYPIYRLIDRFIEIINSFLHDKNISFGVSKGFEITNRLGDKLLPAQLSSGETQLLLMFSFLLDGREKPTVFIIDEPEISLNVKWQRQLIKSLLAITQDTRMQFIFASHSLELLAQHRSRVVQLVTQS